MFYPAFEMEDNPFRYWDRTSERNKTDFGGYVIIKTSAIKKVEKLIRQQGNALVVGNKGCGKTTVIDSFEDDSIIVVSGSEKFRDLYRTLFKKISVDLNQDAIENVTQRIYQTRKTNIPKVRNSDGVLSSGGLIVCSIKNCPMRIRCSLMSTDSSDRWKIIDAIERNIPDESNCPLLEWVSIELCRIKGSKFTYLFDVPDELSGKQKRYFEEFITKLAKVVNQIVMMCTKEQFDSIRPKSEFFMRWNAIEFPPPDNRELKEILRSRVDGIFPFDDEALEYLVAGCKSNPRRLIRTCSGLLDDMIDDGIKEPIGIEYIVGKLNGKSNLPVITDKEAIIGMINGLYEERGNAWVPVSEMVEILRDVYNVKLTNQSVGRRLKNKLRMEGDKLTYRSYKMKRVGLIDWND